MSLLLIVVLRVIHVVAASFWLGTVLLNAGFLLPAVRTTGPAGGQVMKQIVQVRRLPLFINAAVVLALLSGAILIWWDSGGFAIAWVRSGVGLGFTVGAVLAIIAALLGQFVNAPTARRFARLAAQAQQAGSPPPAEILAEMQSLQLRLFRATQLAAVLLLLCAAAMAGARYFY